MLGLFGGKRKAAVNAATEALRPIIGTIQHNYGLPSGFWRDPYVLGFINFSIAHFAKLATRGKIGGEELGYAIGDVYSALSNMNGVSITKNVVELATAKDPDFEKGADDAATVHYYSIGILRNEAENPLVRKASETAKRMRGLDFAGTGMREQISAWMLTYSFIYTVQERFELGKDDVAVDQLIERGEGLAPVSKELFSDCDWISARVCSAADLQNSAISVNELAKTIRDRVGPENVDTDRRSISWGEQKSEDCWISIVIDDGSAGARRVSASAGGHYDGLLFTVLAPDQIAVGIAPPIGRPLGRYVRRAHDELSRRIRFFDSNALVDRMRKGY